MKVVVIDDSANVRRHLVALLSDIPEIEVVGEAANVAQGIKLVDSCRPEGIILDINMPGGSGIDVLRHVRKKYPSAVVIMLTNYHFPQYRDACMTAGADYFFDKSNEFERVGETLLNHFPERRSSGAAA